MLRYKDKNGIVSPLTQYKDLYIEKVLDYGDKTLGFSADQSVVNKIELEDYIITKTDEYVIKQINDSDNNFYDIVAKLNIDALEGNAIQKFETVEQTALNTANLALAGTGWTCECDIKKKRTVRMTNSSSWDILKKIADTFRLEMTIDSLNKKIVYKEKIGEDKGCYFSDQLNLVSLSSQSDTTNFYTRILPIGKDGLTIESVNNGSKFLENHTYSAKNKTYIWKDERYTVPESLKEDAAAKLEELACPYISYSCKLIDLDNSCDVGDVITIINKQKHTRIKQRIVKLKHYPDNPADDTCEISNLKLSFSSYVQKYNNTTDTVDNITNDNGTVDGDCIDNIDASKVLNIDTVIANNAEFVNTKTKVLEVEQSMMATEAKIGTLETTTLKSAEAEITYATIESLKSLSGEFADLKATDFEAIKASVKDLDVDVEKVNTLLFGSATGTTITTDFANSVVSVIGDAQITSAMIKELAFDKLTGIDINTTVMNVHSEDGKSIWKDNTIQIRDRDRVRIQLGKDAAGDYNIYIWDKNGNLMFDPLYGIQESGIKKAIIRNDMVSDNAAISGKKLDIDSVFSVMNADKSNTFNASKIHVDTTDQTLESTFQTINSYIDGGSEAWGSTMLQAKTFIEHKLWWTDIDEEGNSVKSKFNDVKTTLDSFKIDMSDVTKQLSGTFEIYDVTGAPNLDNYPATEFFVPVYPAEDWYPLETDTWQYTQEEYAKHAGAIACMKSAGRYWKFLRQSNGKYGWTEISSSETAYMLNKHTAFQVAIDGITSEVSKVKVDIRDNYSTTTQMISRIVQEIKDDKSTISSSLQATYATQKYADDAANAATSGANNYTDNVLKTYSTTADIIQAISPGKTSISAAVTAKLGDYATSASLEAYIKKDPTTGELKSAIEAIADTINITARGGLNLSGNRFTLSSTNTSITADGTITCSNLIANGGNIGGWKVSKDSISTIFKQDNDLFRITLQIPGDITPYVFAVFHGTKEEGYSKNPNLYISQTGKLYATNAQITGSGYFSSGTIGGWNISKSSIYKDYGKYRTYIQAPANSEAWAFSCQEEKSGAYYGNWYVRADGYMYASKGQIGNFSIDNGMLSTYQNNGIKGMSIDQNYIKFYSWVDDYENYVGSITTTRYYTNNGETRRALALNADYGDVVGINCTKEKTGNTEYEFVIRVNDDMNRSLEFFSPNIYVNGGFQNNIKTPTTLTIYCYNPNSGKDTQNVRITNTDDRHYENCELSVYGSTYIGYDLRCFGSIYGTIASDSDENVKKDIKALEIEQTADFIYSLIPSEFRMKDGTSNRLHHGFIAQEVKEKMGNNDWGLFIDKKINNDNYETQVSDENGNTTKELTARYALRYDELIADLVATVQSQNMRIKKLEKQLSN